MLLTVPKSHIKRTGISSIPLWIIGGLFLYIFASIDLSNEATETFIVAKSTADITNIEKRIPRHNAISLLKRPLFTAKNYSASFKFDNFDNGNSINIVFISSLSLTFDNQKLLEVINNDRSVNHVFAATQRAPPSLI